MLPPRGVQEHCDLAEGQALLNAVHPVRGRLLHGDGGGGEVHQRRGAEAGTQSDAPAEQEGDDDRRGEVRPRALFRVSGKGIPHFGTFERYDCVLYVSLCFQIGIRFVWQGPIMTFCPRTVVITRS